MSEFSESYHLRSDRQEDAIELLRRADLAGYVFPPTNGWVSFVAEGGSFEPDDAVVDAAGKQMLLHYTSAEDDGWSYALFVNGKVVSGYHCAWDPDVEFDDSKYSRATLTQHIPNVGKKELDELELHLRPTNLDEVMEMEASKLFAEAIGLEHYEWLSFDYVDGDFDESSDDFPGVVAVS